MEKWQTPSSYFGFSPVGDYLLLSQLRDSDALTRSNWEIAHKLLSEAAGKPVVFYTGDDDGKPSGAYAWRAGCSMFGWHEYLMISADAPESVIDCGNEIAAALADYPVLDDSHWSELEWNEASEYWSRMDVRERARLIKDSGANCSMFAARRDYLPDDSNGALLEWLR